MLEIFTHFLNNIIIHHINWIYFFAFIFAMMEGIVALSFLPGTTIILFIGTFAASGKLNFYFLFFIVVIGAFIGDNIGYLIGRYTHKWIEKKGWVENEYYVLSKKFIKDHGGKSIFFARFVSVLKEMAPFTAGVMEMSRLRFSFYNFLGAIGWAIIILGGSYWIGEIKSILDFMKILGVLGLLGFMSFMILFYLKHKEHFLK